ALRRRLTADRARLSPDQRAAAARALRDAVLELPQAQMAGTIAAYYSLASEPDTHGLVYALWKRGSYVLLPLLRPDADLDWASYEGPDSLRPRPRGLAARGAAAGGGGGRRGARGGGARRGGGPGGRPAGPGGRQSGPAPGGGRAGAPPRRAPRRGGAAGRAPARPPRPGGRAGRPPLRR